MKGKKKRKKITLSSIVGACICFSLIGGGLYYGLVLGAPGGYFVVALGAILSTLIYLIHRG